MVRDTGDESPLSVLQQWLIGLSAICALFVAGASGWMGLVDALNYHAKTVTAGGEVSPVEAEHEALLASKAAILLHPGDAEAWLRSSLVLGDGACDKLDQACDNTINAWREALIRRPHQPFAWIRLAEAYIDRGDLNLGLASMQRAVYFGPHERMVREKTLIIGLSYWSAMGAADRELLQQMIEWVDRYDRPLLVDVTLSLDMSDQVLQLLQVRGDTAGFSDALVVAQAQKRG